MPARFQQNKQSPGNVVNTTNNNARRLMKRLQTSNDSWLLTIREAFSFSSRTSPSMAGWSPFTVSSDAGGVSPTARGRCLHSHNGAYDDINKNVVEVVTVLSKRYGFPFKPSRKWITWFQLGKSQGNLVSQGNLPITQHSNS